MYYDANDPSNPNRQLQIIQGLWLEGKVSEHCFATSNTDRQVLGVYATNVLSDYAL